MDSDLNNDDKFFEKALQSIKNMSETDSDTDTEDDKYSKHLNLDKNKITILLFKANWCGHCRSFEPIWNKLQDNHKNHDKIVFKTYEHDIEEHKIIMNNLNITGFPTIMLFKNDKYLNYDGPRNYDDIINLINN